MGIPIAVGIGVSREFRGGAQEFRGGSWEFRGGSLSNTHTHTRVRAPGNTQTASNTTTTFGSFIPPDYMTGAEGTQLDIRNCTGTKVLGGHRSDPRAVHWYITPERT